MRRRNNRSREKRRGLVSLREGGMSLQQLSERYGVPVSYARHVIYNPPTRKTYKRVIYPNIRAWLLEQQISIQEFCGLIGVTPGCFRLWFTNGENPSKYYIDKILAVTGLTYEEAFYREDQK